jgi:7-cyano-7-deazaguanine synthase
MTLNEIEQTLPYTTGNVVSVLSGGLDSTTLTYLLAHHYGAERVYALSFFYGQKQSLELERAALTCAKLGIKHKLIDISFLGEIVAPVTSNVASSGISVPTLEEALAHPQPPSYVPYRNMILNSIACSFAESNDAMHVFSGLAAVDAYGYWDTTPNFVSSFNATTTQNRVTPVQLVAPFASLTKADEIDIGTELNVPYEDSLSCYQPDTNGVSCGICPTCSERIKNFMVAGKIDPVPYNRDIDWVSGISKYKRS